MLPRLIGRVSFFSGAGPSTTETQAVSEAKTASIDETIAAASIDPASRTFQQRLENINYNTRLIPSIFCSSIDMKLMNRPCMIDKFKHHIIDADMLTAFNENPFTCTPLQVLTAQLNTEGLTENEIEEHRQQLAYQEWITQQIHIFVTQL